MLHILVVGGGLYPFATGGYASLNYNIACFLSKAKHDEITLWGTIPAGSDVSALKDFYPDSLRLGYLTTPGESHGLVDTLASHAYFTKKMSRSRFDVVHFDLWPGLRGGLLLRIAKLRDSKVVFFVPDVIPFGVNSYTSDLIQKLGGWLNWGILTKSLNLFDAIVCPSRFMLDALANLGFDRDKMMVLPLGVDIERIQNIKAQVPSPPPFILCAGPFMPIKGQHRLIEAFAKSRAKDHSRLVFIGSGTYYGKETRYRRYCIELARKLGLGNAQFMPTAPFGRWIATAKNATICVVPSDYESFSQLTLEAMACGRPVVATKFGGIEDYVVSGTNGVLVDPRDTSALADEIDSLFFNDQQRKRIGESAQKTALQYDWRVVIAKYQTLYQKLIRASNRE